MQARGLSASDVQNAIANQNLIGAPGNIKIGSYLYTVDLNNSSDTIEEGQPTAQDDRRRHDLCP